MKSFKPYPAVLVAAITMSALSVQAAADPVEVDSVVAAVKAANPDFKALCQKGPDGIRQALMRTLMSMVGTGKIKSNPQEVGQEAGMKIGKECRGG